MKTLQEILTSHERDVRREGERNFSMGEAAIASQCFDEADRLSVAIKAIATLTAERDAAIRSQKHTEQFYAVRFRRLHEWATEGGHNEVFAIMMNGTTGPLEPPTYAQQLNLKEHENKRLARALEAAEKLAQGE